MLYYLPTQQQLLAAAGAPEAGVSGELTGVMQLIITKLPQNPVGISCDTQMIVADAPANLYLRIVPYVRAYSRASACLETV